MNRFFLLVSAGLLLALAGCQSQKATTVPQPPPVKLLAYINVSSGCQQATVDFMKGLTQKYPRLQLEMVDFGDGGPGFDRWQKSGNKCMTLELNGQSSVKYPYQGSLKAVSLHMPAGFLWNHEDLQQAVEAAMQGTLQPATEEEAEKGISAEQMQAKVKAVQKAKAAKGAGTAK